MSGTSLDGIDVAIVDITGSGFKAKINVLTSHSVPYPRKIREALLAISNMSAFTGDISRLNFVLGELYAEALEETAERAQIPLSTIKLIGCHGQTIFHEGQGAQYLGKKVASTFQIGESSVISERTGIDVISNFRERDMAAGGRGAPLVPYLDYMLIRHRGRGRVAINIGGVANLTAIPPNTSSDRVIAFDTGPGNIIIDQLVTRITAGGQTYDRDGVIAVSGEVDPKLLAKLLRDKYFRAKPPKTAGREQYGSDYVSKLLDTELSSEDLIATATALTAESIALGVRNFVLTDMRVDEIFVSGGGTHNPTLMKMLRKAMDPIPVMETTEVGLDVDAKEAIAFAVMAYETAHCRPSNVPMATGAKRPVVLGKMTQNGTPRNGSSNGATPINGAVRNNGTATHKVKAPRSTQVSRQTVASKAKAATR
ncbi:MAG: anhydro-N-acetylmuramic acid kinase [Acidobacteriaceae bacterium]|nr:anhydro-N-acetylmuramic acid kinase [Acidobacteriaceae bacterium]MBV9503172.1 anhydro-N-acetylmuramic acid kinase [Acidobacteriaceae bacterium]